MDRMARDMAMVAFAVTMVSVIGFVAVVEGFGPAPSFRGWDVAKAEPWIRADYRAVGMTDKQADEEIGRLIELAGS